MCKQKCSIYPKMVFIRKKNGIKRLQFMISVAKQT